MCGVIAGKHCQLRVIGPAAIESRINAGHLVALVRQTPILQYRFQGLNATPQISGRSHGLDKMFGLYAFV